MSESNSNEPEINEKEVLDYDPVFPKAKENRAHLYAVKDDDEFPCTHSALEFHAAYLTNRMRFYLECAEQGRTDLADIISQDLERENINASFYFRHANEEKLDKKKGK